ncbi:hypothetical protein B4086_5506 [Bacillus cereus]|nr:hypothetical protein B4086_5506 [Bacillus cereus]
MLAGLQAFIRRNIGKAPDYKRSRIEVEVMDDGIYRSLFNGVTVLTHQAMKYPVKQKMGAGDGKVGIEMKIPKIPFKYWLMTLDFYKEIYARYRTEASVFFYWNLKDEEIPQNLYREHKDGILMDGKLLVYCPKQRNTGVLSSFGQDKLLQWLEKHWQCIIETHSHHVMDAFFSSTDDRNEMKPRCYGVFARINTEDAFLTRFCAEGKHYFIEPTDVFEIPKRFKEVTTVVQTKYTYDFGTGEAEEYNNKEADSTVKTEITGVWDNNRTFPESWLNMNLSGIDHSPIYNSEDEAHEANKAQGLFPDESVEENNDLGTVGETSELGEKINEVAEELGGESKTYGDNPIVICPPKLEEEKGKDIPDKDSSNNGKGTEAWWDK